MATLQSTLFSLKNSEPTNNIVMVLNTDGTTWMGIGTSTPTAAFDVRGTQAHTAPSSYGSGGGSSSGWMNFSTTLTTNQSTSSKTAQANLTFSGLTADYAGDICAWDATTTSDTSAFNYTGKLRGGMGHVIIQTATGSTVTFTEAFAGVVRVNPSALGTMTGGYGTSGELLHDSTGAYAITSFNSLQGTQVITGAGTIGVGIAVNGLCQTASGSTGNFTTSAQAIFGQVYHNNTNTIPLAQGVYGNVRCDTTSGIFTLADGVAGQFQHGGTGIMPSVCAIRALSPIFTSSGTVTNKYGLRVQNQGNALITTSYGISVDAQSGSGSASYAIRTQGGKHSFQTAAADQTGWVITDGTTNYVSIDSRTTTNAVSGITLNQSAPTITTAGNATYHLLTLSAYTLTFSGTSTPNNVNGLSLNIAQPIITNAQAQNSLIVSTAYIANAPSLTGSATATAAFALNVAAGNSLFGGAIVQGHAPAAINSTATASAAQAASGYITSTSAATVTITLPTGTALGAALGAAQGTIHYLTIDNTAGANVVTVAVNTNAILSAEAAAVAASAGLLTIPSGATGQGTFMLMFSSATAYTFTRVA